MSTSSLKREIRRFHVVVVQWTSKKCTKKRDARAELLFWYLNSLFFGSRRYGRRRSCLSSLMKDIRFIVECVVNLLLIESFWPCTDILYHQAMMSICWTYAFMQTFTCIYFPRTLFFFQQTNPSVRFWPYWLTRTYTNHIWSSWYNGSLGQSKFRDSAFINVWYFERTNHISWKTISISAN